MSDTIDKKQTLLLMQMREILGNSYSFVRGRQYTETISNLTYEELLDAAIDKISGTAGINPNRGTLLDRIKKIKSEILQAVTTIKKQPSDFWSLNGDDRIQLEDAQNTEE